MKKHILSVGIDIGTTTTHIIFSRISVENIASSFLVPEVKITEKKIIYKSDIYFTPLMTREKINLEELKVIITKEYEKAGICKQDIDTGAIIITGETSRKENAEQVLKYLSEFAGDFVVATAGPDLEAVLAGYGAGASEASKKYTSKIMNFDIGGGTTNASVFWEGDIIDSFALDLGGRLVRINAEGVITYVSEKIKSIIATLNLNIQEGVVPKLNELMKLSDTLASVLYKIIQNESLDSELKKLFIQHYNKELVAELFMFSGGVAEFVYDPMEIKTFEEVIRFGDIGPLLGYSIRKSIESIKSRLLEPKEKIRATVIGAGIHSIRISGSTIVYEDDILPIKNVPIIKLFNKEENLDELYNLICEKIKLYEDVTTAIAFKGPKSPTYIQIKKAAKAIVDAYENSDKPLVIILENDFAKALGQCINNILKGSKKVICIDKIKVDNGDYVDIGKSVSGVVPVVVKTLIFKN
jgi:ethanolamine utilization protein EutA